MTCAEVLCKGPAKGEGVSRLSIWPSYAIESGASIMDI